MKNRDCAGRAVPVSLHADFGFAPPTERRLSVSERPSPAFASALPRSLSQLLPLGSVTTAPLEDDWSIVGEVVVTGVGGRSPLFARQAAGGWRDAAR